MASPLSLAIYIWVGVNVNALATWKWYWIENKPVVFLCWMQDSNPGSLGPKINLFQFEFQFQPSTMLYNYIIIEIEQDYAFISLVQMFLVHALRLSQQTAFLCIDPWKYMVLYNLLWLHYQYTIFSDLNSGPFHNKNILRSCPLCPLWFVCTRWHRIVLQKLICCQICCLNAMRKCYFSMANQKQFHAISTI